MERNELCLEKWGRWGGEEDGGETGRKGSGSRGGRIFLGEEGSGDARPRGTNKPRSYWFMLILVMHCIIRRLRVEWSTLTGSYSLLSLFVSGQAEQEKKTCQGCRTNENVFLDEAELTSQIGRKPLRKHYAKATHDTVTVVHGCWTPGGGGGGGLSAPGLTSLYPRGHPRQGNGFLWPTPIICSTFLELGVFSVYLGTRIS